MPPQNAQRLDGEAVKLLRKRLAAWYAKQRRDLPWRRTRDPYAVWVSEIMLQQTRVETVLRYYEPFLERFPTVQALATSDERALLVTWEGLGYYRRARNLRKAAREIVNSRGGVLPETAKQWRTLPGVGKYTAAAIASITRGETAAVLDGNVKRLIARFAKIEKSIDQTATERHLWQLAGELLNPRSPGDHNQAMMELGARICRPRIPLCGECPLAELCAARQAGVEGDLPLRKAKSAPPTRWAVALLLRRKSDGALLLRRRDEGELLAGLWEFPQEWVKESESTEGAIVQLVRETLGSQDRIPELSITATHVYTHFRLEASAGLLELTAKNEQYLERHLKFSSGECGENPSSASYTWLTPDNRGEYPIHRAHQKLLEQVSK